MSSVASLDLLKICSNARTRTSARAKKPLGQGDLTKFNKLFASLRADGEVKKCSNIEGCLYYSSLYCSSRLCCNCCVGDCVGCAFHRLAAEYKCLQLKHEEDTVYRERFSAIVASSRQGKAVVDYGRFITAFDDSVSSESPPRLTLQEFALSFRLSELGNAVLCTTDRGKKPVPPRCIKIGAYSSDRCTTSVFLMAPAYVMSSSAADSYDTYCRNPATIHQRGTFLRTLGATRLSSVRGLSPDARVVFVDDGEGHRSDDFSNPVRMLRHTLTLNGDSAETLRFMTCSCNEENEATMERLMQFADTRTIADISPLLVAPLACSDGYWHYSCYHLELFQAGALSTSVLQCHDRLRTATDAFLSAEPAAEHTDVELPPADREAALIAAVEAQRLERTQQLQSLQGETGVSVLEVPFARRGGCVLLVLVFNTSHVRSAGVAAVRVGKGGSVSCYSHSNNHSKMGCLCKRTLAALLKIEREVAADKAQELPSVEDVVADDDNVCIFHPFLYSSISHACVSLLHSQFNFPNISCRISLHKASLAKYQRVCDCPISTWMPVVRR
jgi:hypothetical protein